MILLISSTWHEFQNLIRIHSNVWQRSHFNIIKWVFHGLLHPNHIQVLDNGIHPKEPTIHFVYRKNRQAKTIKMRRHLKWWKMNWRHNIVYIETSLHSQLESTHTHYSICMLLRTLMYVTFRKTTPKYFDRVFIFYIFFVFLRLRQKTWSAWYVVDVKCSILSRDHLLYTNRLTTSSGGYKFKEGVWIFIDTISWMWALV